MLSETGRVVSHFSKHDMTKKHMFVQEVLALYATVHWARHLLGPGKYEFKVAMDSKSAAAACSRCYSSNHSMNSLLLRLWCFMKDEDIRLVCVDIDTTLTCADAPSRRKRIASRLAKITAEVLQGRMNGRPEWLYNKQCTLESDYLPLVSDIQVPVDVENVADETWVDILNARENKYFDVFSKRDREDYFAGYLLCM